MSEDPLCPACLITHPESQLLRIPTTHADGREHTKGVCPVDKQTYVKWLPQSDTPLLFFGKYKGRSFLSVAHEDPDYLRWLASVAEKPRLKKFCEAALAAVDPASR